MSRGREAVNKYVNDEERIPGNEFDEYEYEYEYEYENENENENENEGEDYDDDDDDVYVTDVDVFDEIDQGATRAARNFSDDTPPTKIRRYDYDLNPCLDRPSMMSSSSTIGRGRLDLNIDIRPQDADYCDESEVLNLPRLPSEVETMIIARTPLLEMRRLCSLSKPIMALIKSGDLVRERMEIGVREACVFMLASGERNWWAFDQRFTARKILPELPCDYAFRSADKESLCAGTHLLVFGKEIEGPAIWTYEVLLNNWFRSTPMGDSRCLFASASSGDFAYVAGGTSLETDSILNSAEKYDPTTRSWDPLPKMKEKRRMCAGVYMDNKFYVIGGQNQSGDGFTCAEVFDENKNTWVKIPGMLNGLTTSDSPPLVAVVNNELYIFETSTNCLMVYLKDSNSWKDLGPIPVRADIRRGWGVAFKSLGNELLAIGGSNISPFGRGMTVFTCSPYPKAERLEWKLLDDGRNSRSPFVMNCTVMVA